MAPPVERGDIGFAAIVDIVVHLVVVEPFGDELAHSEGRGRLTRAAIFGGAATPATAGGGLLAEGWRKTEGTYVTCP